MNQNFVVRMKGHLSPDRFDKTLNGLVIKYANHHFEQLGKDWQDTIEELENLWMQDIMSRRIKLEGRRGTAQAKMPIENIKNMFDWVTFRDGTKWVFQFGANDTSVGKEMRRMEYARKIDYDAVKKDVPVRPGRVAKKDRETTQIVKPMGLGPIRYTKHILLETWDWQGGEGTRYKFANTAPFRARCMEIFNDAIRHMGKIARKRRRRN